MELRLRKWPRIRVHGQLSVALVGEKRERVEALASIVPALLNSSLPHLSPTTPPSSRPDQIRRPRLVVSCVGCWAIFSHDNFPFREEVVHLQSARRPPSLAASASCPVWPIFPHDCSSSNRIDSPTAPSRSCVRCTYHYLNTIQFEYKLIALSLREAALRNHSVDVARSAPTSITRRFHSTARPIPTPSSRNTQFYKSHIHPRSAPSLFSYELVRTRSSSRRAPASPPSSTPHRRPSASTRIANEASKITNLTRSHILLCSLGLVILS